jgi:hypothetical protein
VEQVRETALSGTYTLEEVQRLKRVGTSGVLVLGKVLCRPEERAMAANLESMAGCSRSFSVLLMAPCVPLVERHYLPAWSGGF